LKNAGCERILNARNGKFFTEDSFQVEEKSPRMLWGMRVKRLLSSALTVKSVNGVSLANTSQQQLVKSFHRRPLPCPPAIAFSSREGRQVFTNALQAGHMDGYFLLAEQFGTQAEPSYCALSSISMVLNAFQVDPYRIWKGSWRWYDESMLDCCTPLSQVQKDGLTFQQAVCLAQCHRLKCEEIGFGGKDVEAFRNAVKRATRWKQDQPSMHLIVSYARKTFEQTGDGHFSPIGGYCPERDLVLILDTARFKYPPHWVPLELLCDAMEEIDSVTGLPRGWMLLAVDDQEIVSSSVIAEDSTNSKTSLTPGKPLYFLLLNQGNDWEALSTRLVEKIEESIQKSCSSSGCPECKQSSILEEEDQETSNSKRLVQCFCEDIPQNLLTEISNCVHLFGVNNVPLEVQEQVEQLKSELHSTPLYQQVYAVLCNMEDDRISRAFDGKELAAEHLTMLLLAFPESFWTEIYESSIGHTVSILSHVQLAKYESLHLLHREIKILRRQMENMFKSCRTRH
jgi:hypothetical protein